MTESAARKGLSFATLRMRLEAGWPVEEALETPPGGRPQKRDGHAKLTWEDAERIRSASGTNEQLGRQYGVSASVIARIRRGEG